METEKKVSRGLHGVSIGTIGAAVFLLLSHPRELASLSWYIDKSDVIQQNVNVVPQVQSAVVEMKIRLDNLERDYAHDNDSLVDLVESLQKAVHVLSVGKQPYDSVNVTLSSGEKKYFHVNTGWIWRR